MRHSALGLEHRVRHRHECRWERQQKEPTQHQKPAHYRNDDCRRPSPALVKRDDDRPPASMKAPVTQGHTGFAPKSVTSALMSEAPHYSRNTRDDEGMGRAPEQTCVCCAATLVKNSLQYLHLMLAARWQPPDHDPVVRSWAALCRPLILMICSGDRCGRRLSEVTVPAMPHNAFAALPVLTPCHGDLPFVFRQVPMTAVPRSPAHGRIERLRC